LIEKLADLDLIHREYLPDVPDTLEAFITEYIEKRTDVKEGTLVTYRQVRKRLVDHFGAGRRLSDTATGDAKQWRRLLLEGGFSEATANRSSATAIQYFNEAIDLKVITVNPFKGLPVVVRGNHDRYHFVDRPTIEKVIEACPSAEWRLIVGLARYAGLRIPSEVVALKWEDISLDGNTMTITSPKTEHHGKGNRVCPIFPALRPLIEDAREAAPTDCEFVLQRYRNPTQNLRTHFQRIIKRAGVEPWVKLWQNLRSSCATELADQYPEHVLTKWLGNTPKVAKEHYFQVTDEHWMRAVLDDSMGKSEVSKCASKCASVPSGLGMNRVTQRFRSESVSVDGARRNTHMQEQVGVTQCAREDSNLHGILLPPAPQAGASANSATRA
jgi:integrase